MRNKKDQSIPFHKNYQLRRGIFAVRSPSLKRDIPCQVESKLSPNLLEMPSNKDSDNVVYLLWSNRRVYRCPMVNVQVSLESTSIRNSTTANVAIWGCIFLQEHPKFPDRSLLYGEFLDKFLNKPRSSLRRNNANLRSKKRKEMGQSKIHV